MPQAATAERLIRGALAAGLAADTDPALVEHVAALVPSRLVAARRA
jgi:inactivated superfamily I helicase